MLPSNWLLGSFIKLSHHLSADDFRQINLFLHVPHLYNGDKNSICLTVVRITTVNIRKALKKSVCHLVGTREVF